MVGKNRQALSDNLLNVQDRRLRCRVGPSNVWPSLRTGGTSPISATSFHQRSPVVYVSILPIGRATSYPTSPASRECEKPWVSSGYWFRWIVVERWILAASRLGEGDEQKYPAQRVRVAQARLLYEGCCKWERNLFFSPNRVCAHRSSHSNRCCEEGCQIPIVRHANRRLGSTARSLSVGLTEPWIVGARLYCGLEYNVDGTQAHHVFGPFWAKSDGFPVPGLTVSAIPQGTRFVYPTFREPTNCLDNTKQSSLSAVSGAGCPLRRCCFPPLVLLAK